MTLAPTMMDLKRRRPPTDEGVTMADTATTTETLEVIVNENDEESSGHGVLRAILIAVGVAAIVAAVAVVLGRRES
jgi:hypothetical protein